jgi:hypothetical protein
VKVPIDTNFMHMEKRFIRTTSEIFESSDKNLYLNSIVFIEDKL